MVSRKESRKYKQLSSVRPQGPFVSTSKDCSLSTRAFEIALFFWVPFISLILVPLAVVYAILGIWKEHKDPKNYGGKGFAIAALALCSIGGIVVIYSIYAFGPDIFFGSKSAAAPIEEISIPLAAIVWCGSIIFLELCGILYFRSKGMIPDQSMPQRKDTSIATIAFFLSLFFLVPLFNLITNPVGLALSIYSLVKQKREPAKYGGFKRAVAALVITGMMVSIIIYALIFIGPSIFER